MGFGTTCRVILVKNIESNRVFACKVQKLRCSESRVFSEEPPELDDLSYTSRAQAEWETRTLADLKHSSILNLRDFAMSDRLCLIVSDYAKGGSLSKLVAQRGGRLSESEARVVMVRLLQGVMHMHKRGITHRDLKIENLLVMSKDDVSSVVIADVGMAKQLGDSGNGIEYGGTDDVDHSVCGSPLFMAPEMISSASKNVDKGRVLACYGQKVDIWSCGIIVFMLLSGETPFIAESLARLFDCIRKGNYNFNTPVWENVSPEGKNFVRHLLTVDCQERPSAAEALLHPWLVSQGACPPLSKSSSSFVRASSSGMLRARKPLGGVRGKNPPISKAMTHLSLLIRNFLL